MQLNGFLSNRLEEASHTDMLTLHFQNTLPPALRISLCDLKTMTLHISSLLQLMTREKSKELHSSLYSTSYLEQLKQTFIKLKDAKDKCQKRLDAMMERVVMAQNCIVSVEEEMKKNLTTAKTLKELLEKEISLLYKGRPVSLLMNRDFHYSS